MEYTIMIEKDAQRQKAKFKAELQTSIDRSMEDLKNGRFYEAKDGADLIKQCLN